MQYGDTAVQIYDVPTSADPNAIFDRRMALVVSAVVLLGLAAFVAFVIFGIYSQQGFHSQ